MTPFCISQKPCYTDIHSIPYGRCDRIKKNQNIILFSSGVSEESGLVAFVTEQLHKRGFNCYCWRELFRNSNDHNAIALLPMLIKKIPTFDFAVLICEGHDRTVLRLPPHLAM